MLNITAAWQASHAHLQPYKKHLALPPGQMHTCEACGGTAAYTLLADLQLSGGEWAKGVAVTCCSACEQFMVPASVVAGEAVVAVNARLWSMSPTALNIEPTTRCNFRCWYCVGRHMEQRDIRVDDFARVLEHIPAVTAIALVGEGEPLLHPHFFEMVDMATEAGKKVVILSNGALLNQTNIEKLCTSGVLYVSISIDSTDPARFARSRIHGDLAAILHNMQHLRKYRDANGYRYPKIAVKGTLFDYSADELPGIVALAREHGAELFESFQPLNPKQSYVNAYPEEHKPQLAVVDKVQQAILRDNAAARQILRPFEEFFAEEELAFGGAEKANCLRPNCDEQHLYALLSGEVTPCCQIKDVVNPAWNLVHQPLANILADKSYENLRFNLWNGIFPDYCKGCWKLASPHPAVTTAGQKGAGTLKVKVMHSPETALMQDLFRKVYGNEISQAMLEWKYGGDRGTSYGVFAEDGVLLAHCGVFHRTVLAEGKRYRIGQLGDLMALPGRHGGLSRLGSPFSALIQHLLAELPGGNNPDGLAFGFPSDRAMRLGERLGLFAPIDRMCQLVFTPLPPSWKADRCIPLSPADSRFSGIIDKLWCAMAEAFGNDLIGVRDAEYLIQRYARHPVYTYNLHLIVSRWLGTPLGVLVTRIDAGACELLDIIAPPATISRLLQAARRQLADWGAQSMTAWLTERHARTFEPLAQSCNPLEIRIMANPFSSEGTPGRFAHRWWLTSGDTDYH